MQRLSSRSTLFFKRVFPAFWSGFVALWTVARASSAVATHNMKTPAAFRPSPVAAGLIQRIDALRQRRPA